MKGKKHTYLVTLTREVLRATPDETTVRATEHADVVIHSDTELAHEVPTGCTITGDWKLSIEPEGHVHDGNKGIVFGSCDNGHLWAVDGEFPCWCGWTGGKLKVVKL